MHFIFSLSRLECTALKTRAEMGCLPWYMPQGNTVFLVIGMCWPLCVL